MKLLKSIYAVICVFSLTAFFQSCDAHMDFPDTAMKVCDVLCTDGKVVSYDKYLSEGKKPVAVVFHINHSEEIEGVGYALYLWDLNSTQFCDSIGVKQNTSASLNEYDGNYNTYALLTTKEAKSPMAESVDNIWPYEQSAYIPSVAQMDLLYHAKKSINETIEKLGGDTISNDPDECWYWTSTEVANQERNKAWLYSLAAGTYQETPKTISHKCRPIITLRY